MTMRARGSRAKNQARATLSRVRRRLRASAAQRLPRQRATPEPLPAALLAFTGGHGTGPEAGRELYRDEPVFRESIDACARVMPEPLGDELAESFRGPEDPGSVDPALELARSGALQIGLCDLWRSAGVIPAATLGIGLGEIGAAYAAHALTRDDAAIVVGAIATIVSKNACPGVVFTVDVDGETARTLCGAAPGELRLLGTLERGRCLLWSPDPDAPAVRAFLTESAPLTHAVASAWREHTTQASDLAALEAALEGVVSRPPLCQVYSAAGGGVLWDARFDAAHWDWVMSRQFFLADAAVPAIRKAPRLVIRIGTDSDQTRGLEAAAGELGAQPALIDSLRADGDELVTWKRAVEAVGGLGDLRRTRPQPQGSPQGDRAPAGTRPRATPATLLLDDPAVAKDPFAHYEDLRPEGPVHFLKQHNSWLVLGYEEVVAALSRPQIYSSQITAPVDPVLLGSDGRPHAQVRRALAGAFSAEAARKLAPELDAVAPTLLRPLLEDGELDVVRQFASPLAYYVGARLLELDEESAATVTAAVGDAEAEPVTLLGRLAGVSELLKERSGLVAQLRTRQDFDDEQIRSLLRLLWVASTATAKRVIASAVRVLSDDLPLRRRLIDDPELIGAFVEEAVRLHPPELITLRITTEDTVLGGTAIPQGSVVNLGLAAANRDPRRFESPAEFRLDRTVSHVSFGSGSHGCPGAAFARAEVRSAIAALLEAAPDFSSPQPRSMLRYLPAMSTHGLEHLVIADAASPHSAPMPRRDERGLV